MGEVVAEIYPNIADWLLDSLINGRPSDYNNEVYIEEGTVLADYEHG